MPHALPRELAEFLHFQHYELTFLLQELARFYFAHADTLLQDATPTNFQPLQVMVLFLVLLSIMIKTMLQTTLFNFFKVADFCKRTMIFKNFILQDVYHDKCTYDVRKIKYYQFNLYI